MKMKKLILLSLTLGLTFPGAHMLAGVMNRERQESAEEIVTDAADKPENNNNAQEAKSDEIKMDPFSLPRDLQNTLLEMLWFENNPEEFVQNIEAIFKATKSLRKKHDWTKTVSERNTYGYHGQKIPILFYTLVDNKPIIHKVGTIIKNATPTYLGLGWGRNAVETHELFLNGPDKSYHAQLKLLGPYKLIIKSCALSVNGTIAVYWQGLHNNLDENIENISIFTIDDIKNNNLILDTNAKNTFRIKKTPDDLFTESTDDYNKVTLTHLIGMLFNPPGNQLAFVCHNRTRTVYKSNPEKNKTEKNIKVKILDTPIPLTNKPLTQEQIAKRLMLPTTQLKEQLEHQSESRTNQEKIDQQPADCSIQ